MPLKGRDYYMNINNLDEATVGTFLELDLGQRNFMLTKATRLIHNALTCAITCVAMTGFVACGPNSSAPAANQAPQGPGGTGGGDVMLPQSSIEDVEAVVDKEFSGISAQFSGHYAIALSPFFDIGKNRALIESDFAKAFNETPELKRFRAIVANLLRDAKSVEKYGTHYLIDAPVMNSVLQSLHLNKKADGACSDSAQDHHDASVKEKTVCFSLKRVARVPQTALKTEVRALLAHEFMHSLGYDEADAQLMQRYFIFELGSGRMEIRQAIWNELRNIIKYATELRDVKPFNRVRELPPLGYVLMENGIRPFQPSRINVAISEKDKAVWLPRLEDQDRKIEDMSRKLAELAIGSTDGQNSAAEKAAAYEALMSELIVAEKLLFEFLPFKLSGKVLLDQTAH
jgi:hypothetical protein